MREPILIVNAGSSSLKFSLFETVGDGSLTPQLHGQVDGLTGSPRLSIADASGHSLVDRSIDGQGHEGAIAAIQDWFARHVGRETDFYGVGHRIVHGGPTYSSPVLIDASVLDALEQLVPLAPLHEPAQIAAIRAVAARAPQVPQVACFDTAFHSQQPSVAREFALPREYSVRGIRRYGFHGLSYEYIASVLPRVAPEYAQARVIVAHLGNGASMCAMANGGSVATTMGFTALDGLPMGTRCGTLDPGVLLYLMQHEHMTPDAIEQLLYQRSGLLGVSGVSADMRELLASGEAGAAQAVDLFVYRIGRELGSLAASLGGLDALVFTGGIGEHAHQIRSRVCRDARWLGIELDETANMQGGPRISRAGSSTSAWVIATDENLMVARHTQQVLARAAG